MKDPKTADMKSADKKIESSAGSKKQTIMIFSGVFGLVTSLLLFPIRGYISDGLAIILMLVSLAFGGISGYIGDNLFKHKIKAGWIGICFMTLTIILVLAPVLFDFF